MLRNDQSYDIKNLMLYYQWHAIVCIIFSHHRSDGDGDGDADGGMPLDAPFEPPRRRSRVTSMISAVHDAREAAGTVLRVSLDKFGSTIRSITDYDNIESERLGGFLYVCQVLLILLNTLLINVMHNIIIQYIYYHNSNILLYYVNVVAMHCHSTIHRHRTVLPYDSQTNRGPEGVSQ